MIQGVDVSSHQGIFDWDKAKEVGVRYAFLRCTFGKLLDTQFQRNWAEAKRVGIPRGAYGWCLFNANQVSMATLFVKQLKDDYGELPPVVDFEKWGDGWVGFGALQLYCETIEKLMNRKPIIYTSYGYWESLRDFSGQFWATNYDLWLAQYTGNVVPYRIPKPFEDWKFWQFTSVGDGNAYGVPKKGSPIDLDRFNGDEVAFQKYIKGVIPTPPPTSNLESRVAKLEAWARTQGYGG